jgi:drug/metabolite transporter (DMT)-like permease
MLWIVLAGIVFTALNVITRQMTLELPPLETQFLRYAAGALVMLPLALQEGLATYRPHGGAWGQVRRGVVHTAGLLFWFTALPHIPLADVTAIGFSTPVFVMAGAVLFLGERMRWERWAAAGGGIAGLLVVIGPSLSGAGGAYTLVMLASAPLMAASYLISKALTRHDRPQVIVAWQSLTVALCSLPFAAWDWVTPTLVQSGLFLIAGILGSLGHYFLTRGFRVADISATQPARFLDLAWNVAAGWAVFGDVPTLSTLAGAVIIFLATSWLARRESLARRT